MIVQRALKTTLALGRDATSSFECAVCAAPAAQDEGERGEIGTLARDILLKLLQKRSLTREGLRILRHHLRKAEVSYGTFDKTVGIHSVGAGDPAVRKSTCAVRRLTSKIQEIQWENHEFWGRGIWKKFEMLRKQWENNCF